MRARSRALAGLLVVIGAAAILVPFLGRAEDGPAAAADLEDQLRAQADAPLDIQRTGDHVRFVGAQPGDTVDVGGPDPAGTFVDTYGPLLGTDLPDVDLQPLSTAPSLDGGSANRYQQTVAGIPVFGGQVSVQVAPDGGIRSALADVSVRAGADPPDLDATVTPAEARAVAVDATVRATGVSVDDLQATDPEQWIYDPEVVGPATAFGPSLTWQVEVTDRAGTVRQLVLVDARQGGVALTFSEIAHGLDRKVCDAANVRQAEPCVAPYARTEGQPPLSPDTNPATGNEVDLVYTYSGETYDFYADRFGRDGIADDGGSLISKIRFCSTDSSTSCPYNNAFWNGSQLTFGQGYARADDVVAHELAHGVTEHTANLFYWYQSGAMNESMSDVFGELVDLTDGLGNDAAGVRWDLGEDLPGGALRDMANPSAFSDPDRTTSALYTGTSTDGGGVHTNSGVGNRTAVLITDGGTISGHPAVTGIGIEKTAAVYYETLSTLLVSGSDYADLGVALPQACANLAAGSVAGITPADCTQVQAAVVATELATVPPNSPAPEAPVCAAGQMPQYLFNDDLENQASGNWAFQTASGPYRWAYEPTPIIEYATSGVQSFWGPDAGQTSDRSIAMTASVALPAGSTPYLRFRHAHAFESSGATNYDGGVVEYSTNGGSTWQQTLGPLFDSNGYSGTLVNSGTNPLKGKQAFVNASRGYISSRANLSTLAGQSVRFRFRIGEDVNVGTPYGWFVDDIQIYTCVPIPNPAMTVTYSADQSSVVAGQAVSLHVAVNNTGNVTLTNVAIDAANANSCDGPVANLVPNATTTVNCSYTTVDPGDVGTWTDTATGTATQLPSAVTSAPVSVTVLASSPAATVTQTTDESSVVVGQTVHLHVTVQNTGNVTLTGLALSNDTATACDGSLADLAPAAQTVVDCAATTAASGTWTNTATVDADQLAAPVASAPVSVTVTPVPVASATIAETADQTAVVAGQGIGLHVTVHNTGDLALSGITVSHTRATTCNGPVADLAPGAQVTVDCTAPTVHPTDVGTWSDTASVSATQLSSAVSASPVSVTVAAQAPALDVDLTADQTQVDAGDDIDLHLELTNTGNVTLTGLVVTETDCGGPVAALAPAAATTVDCTHTTAATDQGPYTTTASVDSDQLAPVTSEEVEVLVLRAALDIDVTAQTGTVVAGQSVTLDIGVHNPGNVGLTGLTVTAPDCTTPIAAFALAAGADTEVSCAATTGPDDVPPFALTGVWDPEVTVDSTQTAPATASLDVPVVVTIPPHAFTDGVAWADEAISWLSFHGIADGFDDGTFRPDAEITRGQVVRMVWRLAGEPPAPTPGCGADAFSDIPTWVRPAADWATCDPDGAGPDPALMAGFPDGTFRAASNITRGQVVRMVWRLAGEPDPAVGCTPVALSDVPVWVRSAVDWATCDPDGAGPDPSLMAGFPNATFRPDDPITRAQVARLLLRTSVLLGL